MKKIFFFGLIVFLLIVFLYDGSEKKIVNIKKEVTKYFKPFTIEDEIGIDSLLNNYFYFVDTTNTFYKIVEEYDSATQKTTSYKFFNFRNELFAQECWWFWKYENLSEIVEDTSICKDFDYYKDWRLNEFTEGGVIHDDFLNSDESRTIVYSHGGGCVCCSDVDFKFKTIRFHERDDPRNIIDNHHKSNIILSNIDSEFQRKKMGAISYTSKKDSLNSVVLSVTKLNDSRYNSEKKDVVIIKKVSQFYY